MTVRKGQSEATFTKRESEVMGILFREDSATAREIWSALGELRSYSTIRKILSILEEKGHVTRRAGNGAAIVYSPKLKRDAAASTALGRLVDTFFQGSVASAVSGLLGEKGKGLSAEELERIAVIVEEAKRNKKKQKEKS
jgi:BlaI family penicillinase repressor